MESGTLQSLMWARLSSLSLSSGSEDLFRHLVLSRKAPKQYVLSSYSLLCFYLHAWVYPSVNTFNYMCMSVFLHACTCTLCLHCPQQSKGVTKFPGNFRESEIVLKNHVGAGKRTQALWKGSALNCYAPSRALSLSAPLLPSAWRILPAPAFGVVVGLGLFRRNCASCCPIAPLV